MSPLTAAQLDRAEETVAPVFSSRYAVDLVPKYSLPERELPKDAAYQMIHDELMLDGNPRLNLASFVTTWMEPECDRLIQESLNKNYVDMDEYPVTTELQDRCVNMVARLFHAPTHPNETCVGTGTIGSSEAIMLAGLACKRKWQLARQAAGLPTDHPNIICGANLQVVWEKFARYFEVELREVSLEPGQLVLDPRRAVEMADERTICVVAILGSTFNGEFEDVAALDRLLEEKKKSTGLDIPIHVDAASGGFVAPFLWPDLAWDFRLKRVCSINVSGHKYGLVYPGIGWVVWRSREQLPEDLVFHINYLGADQPTFTLNFSKSACQIIAQYYQFIRLGFEGYRRVMENCRTEATFLTQGLVNSGRFEMLSKDVGVPVVAASLKSRDDFDEDDICEHLRRFGWTIPSYTLPPNLQDHKMLRMVVREDFNRSLAERLLIDFKKTLEYLDEHKPKRKDARRQQDLQPSTPQVRGAPKRKAVEKMEELPHVLDQEALKGRAFRHKKKFSIDKTNPPC